MSTSALILVAMLKLTPLHLWIGAGIGFCAAAIALYLCFTSLIGPGARSDKTKDELNSGADPFVDGSQSESRANCRRKGRQIEVDISHRDDPKRIWKGWVIDRSSGGLKLASDQSVTDGTPLCVRVTQSADFMPWIDIEVRHCKPMPKGWELGCKFVKAPTWNILLSFG